MTGELTTTLPPFLQRRLNRRFYLTQKARDAQVYGILVGTLSQQHFTSVVSTLQRIIADAGKSSYTFAVGKINGAKLANFGEIDCFVLVACGEHSLLDNERDLHVPVITPLELDIALGNAEWGFYSLNYSEFLRRKEGETAGAVTEEDADAPYYSLISGKLIDSKKEELDLSALPGKGQIAAYKSEASNHLRNREYRGLEANIGKDEAHEAVPGQTGIASDYGNR
jgi:diphthamide biosynthesis protein 2